VVSTGSAALNLIVVNHAAAGEGLVDLRIQVISIGEHEESEVASELAMDFAGEHHHGIALSCALGVPEDPQLSMQLFALTDRFNGPVDSEELVIFGQDLLRLAPGLIEEYEVLQQIQEVAFVADAFEKSFHVHRSSLLFSQAFPLVEVLPFAGDGADLCLLAIAEHHNGVMMEDVRDGVQVVREVFLEGGFEVLVDILALNEKQRQSVYETDDICPAAVQVARHPQLSHD